MPARINITGRVAVINVFLYNSAAILKRLILALTVLQKQHMGAPFLTVVYKLKSFYFMHLCVLQTVISQRQKGLLGSN